MHTHKYEYINTHVYKHLCIQKQTQNLNMCMSRGKHKHVQSSQNNIHLGIRHS